MRDLQQRDWILFCRRNPHRPGVCSFTPPKPATPSNANSASYQGTFAGARRYILHTFTHSPAPDEKRVAVQARQPVPACAGKRLNKAALSVEIARRGRWRTVAKCLCCNSPNCCDRWPKGRASLSVEKRLAARRIAQDLLSVSTLTDLGLGYLA